MTSTNSPGSQFDARADGLLGLPMRQIPTDNWLMLELMGDIKPDFVVDTVETAPKLITQQLCA